MDHVGRRVELDLATFADQDNSAPFARGADRGRTGGGMGRAVDRALDAVAAGELAHLVDVVGAGGQRLVAQAEIARELHAVFVHVDANDLRRAQLAAERRRGQTDGAEAGDEHRVVAADADFFEAFVNRAEAAGNLRAVGIGERIGEVNQVLLLREKVIGHAAIALPAVGAAILFARAGNHVTAPAIVANAAAGNVVDDHAVAFAELAAAGPGLHDLAARFVARDDALVAFGAFAEVLVINAADVGAADGRGLHPDEDFAVAGRGHGKTFELGGAVARQEGALHLIGQREGAHNKERMLRFRPG